MSTFPKRLTNIRLVRSKCDREYATGCRDVNAVDEEGNFWYGFQYRGQPIEDVIWYPNFPFDYTNQPVNEVY